MDIQLNNIYNIDCFEGMKHIPDGSVDLILSDPPYGTMKDFNEKFTWDTALPPEKIFSEASRILRRNGKMVLFSQEPYTSRLITNTPPSMVFNYRGIWHKGSSANCMSAQSAMVNCFEDFLVFTNKESGGLINKCVEKISDVVFSIGFHEFAEIMYREGRYKNIASAKNNLYKKVYIEGRNEYDKNFFDEKMYRFLEAQIKMPYTFDEYFDLVADYKKKTQSTFNLWQGGKSKSNVLNYKRDAEKLHPTQKPVRLLMDLVKTYSNEGDTVLDFTMGSGSTPVACIRAKRNYIGFELSPEYYEVASKRLNREKERAVLLNGAE